jgi:hypothetical protein
MTLGGRVVLIALVLAGCGDDDDGSGSNDDRTAKVVAASLTSNVRFAEGTVELGDIPATSASSVSLRQEDQVLSLAPNTAQIMALEVENPDEDEDPVTATLMQFEGDDENHIEVPKKTGGDAGAADEISLMFTVNDDVCAELCNDTFEITMIQAVKLKSDKVSRHLKRTIKLDCSDDGDPDKCEDTSAPAGGKGGKSGSSGKGGGGASGSSGPTTVAEEFARALGTNTLALCRCPEFGMVMGSAGCKSLLPHPAVACIRDHLVEDGLDSETATVVGMLYDELVTSAAACMSCDLTTCDPQLLADALPMLPEGVRAQWETCAEMAGGVIGGTPPDAGTP